MPRATTTRRNVMRAAAAAAAMTGPAVARPSRHRFDAAQESSDNTAATLLVLLSPGSRDLLHGWMVNTRIGTHRLREGLPSTGRSGNKTGTGRTEGTTNKCNDVAITFPPDRAPVIIAAYFDSGEYTPQIERRHEAVLAEVGRIAAEWAVS
jgi:hypothetical protein